MLLNVTVFFLQSDKEVIKRDFCTAKHRVVVSDTPNAHWVGPEEIAIISYDLPPKCPVLTASNTSEYHCVSSCKQCPMNVRMEQ